MFQTVYSCESAQIFACLYLDLDTSGGMDWNSLGGELVTKLLKEVRLWRRFFCA